MQYPTRLSGWKAVQSGRALGIPRTGCRGDACRESVRCRYCSEGAHARRTVAIVNQTRGREILVPRQTLEPVAAFADGRVRARVDTDRSLDACRASV